MTRKNIVICSDGTGNTSIKGRGTNVFKLFEAVDLNGHRFDPSLRPQVALYDDGVGTENLKLVRAFAGMTGYGLSRNVRQLYKELVRIYDPDDQIYLFGFSRGAFTVRTLAGFISTCGFIDAEQTGSAHELDRRVKQAYRVYRRCYRTWLAQRFLGKLDPSVAERFKEKFSRPGTPSIRFIGVWDTVDAVGLPFHLADIINTVFYRFKFRDTKLSSVVQAACHALAIDDARHSFEPLLWDETDEPTGRIEQVWFAGAHSNVGGGYPKQGMSLVALDWMLAKAEAAGLRFLPADRALIAQHANVDDKLYDPRAGLGIFYRWKLRDVAALCDAKKVTPRLHVTVLERAVHGTEDYTPGNLPPRTRLVSTPSATGARLDLLAQRAANLEEAFARCSGDAPVMRQVTRSMRLGWLAYYVYLVVCMFAVVLGLGLIWQLVSSTGMTLRAALGELWARHTPLIELSSTVGMGLLAAYLMTRVADSKMSAVFSEFWHSAQVKLRRSLQQARESVT